MIFFALAAVLWMAYGRELLDYIEHQKRGGGLMEWGLLIGFGAILLLVVVQAFRDASWDETQFERERVIDELHNWRHELDAMSRGDLIAVVADQHERAEVREYAARLIHGVQR